MKRFMMNCKERLANKKGMTLIELLIVLVVFAIIAAFSMPSYLGFVEDARNKAYIAEARTCYVAGQVIATEKFATSEDTADDVAKYITVVDGAVVEDENKRFIEMVGGDVFTSGSKISVTPTIDANTGKVTAIEYKRPLGTATDSKTVKITITAGGKGAEVVVE